ncbi:MAG: YigZ family protein [Bacteroidetes bacterium]|nr:YigZ family protein [Bacteroidota bacterium]MDA1122105.1 YigZ family protein [Bacteroidota bacterium]
MDSFLTIKAEATGLYKEKGSKFLSFAFPVQSEDDIKRFLEKLRKEYHDARHHCYAYILKADQSQFRANDDGEPNHSAGDPILGKIRSRNLTNTLVVVVRYFGGTKLGVSGLINAYKTAASDSLDKIEVRRIIITQPIELEFEYGVTNEVIRLVHEFSLELSNQKFNEPCKISALIPPADRDKFI